LAAVLASFVVTAMPLPLFGSTPLGSIYPQGGRERTSDAARARSSRETGAGVK
jgi:hypothetical protein